MASVPQLVGCALKTLLVAAFMWPLCGTDPAVPAAGAVAPSVIWAGGGAAAIGEEKMLKLPARTPVGWVARPEMDGEACPGIVPSGSPAVLACPPAGIRLPVCAWRAPVETIGSTYFPEAEAPLLATVSLDSATVVSAVPSPASAVLLAVLHEVRIKTQHAASAIRICRSRWRVMFFQALFTGMPLMRESRGKNHRDGILWQG
ncbi:hypothetical protein N7E02_24825 [Aliirhizobium terrae]|uniref:hypothetical protein n=1 Tax=Terrirhizobium terrae TaxID=2926709 RepID=UPI0025755DD5|nr:hypothetical protein [Rhizobium sp. CC-CFT758]WJH39888.1 hypothetical protein N7E02_24825 [Rhizobium sp. CC-CFT758]